MNTIRKWSLFGTPKRVIATLSTATVVCFLISFEIFYPGILSETADSISSMLPSQIIIKIMLVWIPFVLVLGYVILHIGYFVLLFLYFRFGNKGVPK